MLGFSPKKNSWREKKVYNRSTGQTGAVISNASSTPSFLTLSYFLQVKIAAAKIPITLKKLQCHHFQRNFLLFLCTALK